MSKRTKFTDKQAKFLCDALEAHGWTVFHAEDELECSSCGEGQRLEWDYCPFCGADHADYPCSRDSEASKETISLVRDLVEEALAI